MILRYAIVATAVLGATPALAQAPAPSATLEQVLLAAPEAARSAFMVAGDALLHRGSNFRCPAAVSEFTLSSVGSEGLPGQEAGETSSCIYSEGDVPVGRVIFSREKPESEVLGRALCSTLPKALGLRLNPPIPGANRMEGPQTLASAPPVRVGGQQLPPWHCAWMKSPYQMGDIVMTLAAVRPEGGWTVRALHTPPAPPKGTTRFPLRQGMGSLFLVAAAVEGDGAGR